MRDQQSAKPSDQPREGEAAIQKLWEDAAEEFHKICGESLQRGDIKTFEDVRTTIEALGEKGGSASSDEVHPDDWRDKTKSVGLQCLHYLSVLVTYSSQALTFVPAPQAAVTMVSNALCFVFSIPKELANYAAAIHTVFAMISSALAQVNIYKSMDKIDPALVKQIHLVMTSFVKLSAHVVKYKQPARKRDLFLDKLKVGLLREDKGLNDEMTEFRRVLQQQHDVEGTVILSLAVKNDQKVGMLMDWSTIAQKTAEVTQQSVQALQNDSDRDKQLKHIKDTLGFPASFNEKLESKTTEACNIYAEKCLAGTGLWIRDNDAYQQWTVTKGQSPPSYPVLLLSGPPSSGKSCACALITKQLEGQKPEDRIYVANYFFPKRQSDEPNPLQVALKYMALQIAKVDPAVQAALYKACVAESNAIRATVPLKGLWEKLKVGTPGSGATYYLVFDGLDNLPPEHSKNLMEFILELQVSGDEKSAGSIRVLASGTDDKFDAWRSSSALRIKMEAQNVPDMQVVIEDKLKGQGMLQRPIPNSDQERARKMISEKLLNNVDGSYSRLELGLNEVIHLLDTRKTIKELESKLNEFISSREAAIKNLQRSLTLDEIKELNELLKWVLYSNPDRGPLDLKQLEAAWMFLDTESPPLVPWPFEDVIKNKYPAILKIEGGYVYVPDLIRAELTKNNDSNARPQRQDSSINMTITVKNADEETCGNFLWDLAHQSNREKFKFDLNAINASSNSQAVIAVDEFNAHHSMLLKTFQFLEKEPNDQTSHFGRYLVCWLPHHLGRLRSLEDPGKIGRSLRWHQKQEIGKKLYELFRDNTIFERHRAAFYHNHSWWNVEEMKVVREWLTDSGVVRGITDQPWREHVQQFNSPAKGYLAIFTKMTVEIFLRQRNADAEAAFNWLKEIMAADEKASGKISNSEADETTAASAPLSDTDSTDWNRISSWCQCFLELEEEDLDSLWYERLATYSFSRYPYSAKDTVASLYDRALSRDNASWLCHRGLGETYARDQSWSQGPKAGSRHSDAMKHMERALTEAEREGALPQPTPKDIVALLLLVGQYAEALEQGERAAECYAKASDSDDAEQAQEGQLGLLRARLSGADSDETKKWLQQELATKGGEDRMVQVLRKAARKYDEHEALILKLFSVASGNLDLWKDVTRAIEMASPPEPALGQVLLAQLDQDAIEQRNRDIDNESTGVLLYYRGIATYMHGKPSDAREPTGEALRLWKACRETLSTISSYNASIVRRKASTEIGRHLFQDMLDNHHADHIKTLEELATDAEGEYDGDCSGYLGALYAARHETEQSKKVLMRAVRLGLQILSDETPDNDTWGFLTIWNALVQNGSFENAATSLFLRFYPDPIAKALCNFGQEDCPLEVEGAYSQEQLLEMISQLATKTMDAIKSQVTAYSKQTLRMQASLKYVDSCLAELASEVAGVDEAVEGPGEMVAIAPKVETAAYNIIRARLCSTQSALTWEMNWSFSCDGLTKDGNPCTNPTFYHCIFCPNTDFCDECLEVLRHRVHGELKKGACSSGHSWVKVPPPDSPMYVGPTATKVSRPMVVKQADNPNILEIIENPDDVVSVEEWKSGLAKDWGIKLAVENTV